MSALHPPLEMVETRDFEWPIQFQNTDGTAKDVSGNTYACDLATAPLSEGGTVLVSVAFDMADAANGNVVGSLAGSSVTAALAGTVWDLKVTTPGPVEDTVCHGTVEVERVVTA